MLYAGDGAESRRLADAPEQGQRRLHNAADILAPCMMPERHAEWHIEDVVEGGLVQPSGNRLLLIGALGVIPSLDLGFDLCTGRPTVDRLVAISAKVPAGWVRELDAINAGDKHVPSAMIWRRLLL